MHWTSAHYIGRFFKLKSLLRYMLGNPEKAKKCIFSKNVKKRDFSIFLGPKPYRKIRKIGFSTKYKEKREYLAFLRHFRSENGSKIRLFLSFFTFFSHFFRIFSLFFAVLCIICAYSSAVVSSSYILWLLALRPMFTYSSYNSTAVNKIHTVLAWDQMVLYDKVVSLLLFDFN